MAAIVGIDAKVEISTDGVEFSELPERNEFSISINVDVAEHKVFVESLADAWVDKARTWMSWSGSLSGYYDDADDQIFDAVVDGEEVELRFYVSRNGTKYWTGKALLTSVEHSSNTDDYATLNVDFEGTGPLTRGEDTP
jgi:predicted secreted protein